MEPGPNGQGDPGPSSVYPGSLETSEIMTPILLLVALLLFVWLMIRLGRKGGSAGASVGIKVVRSLLLLAALILGLVYCWFRMERSRADVERSRKTARELVEVMDRYNAEKGIVSAFVGGEVYDSVETLVDLANDGDLGRIQQAAQDARYCLTEVNREMGPLDLVLFSQPTPCRAMFHALGEPGELADAGATFTNVAARVAGDDPGESRGPACREWKIGAVKLTLPKTKKSGEPWDVGGDPPDPVISLRVGSGQRVRSPVTQDRHELEWKPKNPLLATPGAKLELHVHDSDAIDDDFAFGYEATVPTNSGPSWVVGERPNLVTILLDCAR